MYTDRWDIGNKSELGIKTCRVNPETEVNKERQSWDWLEEDAGKSSECHRMQAHIHALKQMSPKHAYHTPSDTHAYILQQRASSKRVASCRRSLREQNTTCPLIFSSRAKRGSLSNWSHLHILSHPRLNWSLSAIFFCCPPPPCLCCSFPSLLLCVWSRSTRFCAITSRTVQPGSILHMVPKMEMMIRHGEVSLWGKGGQFCQMMFVLLADRNLASTSAICVCENRLWGQPVSVSVFILALLFTSLLCLPLVLLLLRWEFGCRLIEGRLASDTSHC